MTLYTSDTEVRANAAAECAAEKAAAGEGSLRTGMIYLAASLVIAAAAAVYGLFGHGVYSYWMTYAFMIPLLLGAAPHLLAAQNTCQECQQEPSLLSSSSTPLTRRPRRMQLPNDAQAAVIAALTTGSLLKGALDIYGTSNRLLIAYPVIAALTVIAAVIIAKRGKSKTPGGPAAETLETAETVETAE